MYNEDHKKSNKVFQERNSKSLLNNLFRKRTRRLLTDTGRIFDKIMWSLLTLSVVTIILGLIFLLNPTTSTKTICVLFGIVVLMGGIYNIYCFLKRRSISIFRFYLIYGIIGIILGIITIMNPFEFSQVVTIFIGMWIIYLAFIKLDLAIRLRMIRESSWLLLVVSALLEIFMSVLIFIDPFSNLAITQVVGAYFILCGILNGTDIVLTKNRAQDFLDNI